MKILAYGVREDEKPFVKEWEQENPEVEVEITDKLLDEETVAMAKGFDGGSCLPAKAIYRCGF